MRSITFWAFIAALGLLSPRANLAAEADAVETAWRMIDDGALLIDVRSAEEYAAAHLPGAVNIPHDLTPVLAWFIEDRSRPVVLYCRSGRRSELARQALVDRGFSQVYNGTGLDALQRFRSVRPGVD